MNEIFSASAITHIYLSRKAEAEDMDVARETARHDISVLFAQFRLEAFRMGFMVDIEPETLTIACSTE